MKPDVRCCVLAATAGVLFLAGSIAAGDWPTYRHDVARSGVTAETLQTPLASCWVFQPLAAPAQAWGEPNPRPVSWGSSSEGRRLQFDDAFHVAVADGRVYFGSSADGRIYALAAATGRILWTAFTDGPVRLAPAVWDGKVYVGSDDGHAYCFDGRTGKALWTFRAAPLERRLLGSGRMISLWPLRTGVLVDGRGTHGSPAVAYFGAGVFPSEGVYLYAVNAADGSLIWRTDAEAMAARHTNPYYDTISQGTISPQGYLLASARTLFLPMGRVAPAGFDRQDGRLVCETYKFPEIGGSFVLLDEGRPVVGGEKIAEFEPDTQDGFATKRFAWYGGRQIVVTPETAYLADGRQLAALDRRTYPQASMRRQELAEKRADIQGAADEAQSRVQKQEVAVKESGAALKALDEEIGRLAGQPVSAELQARRDQAARRAEADRQQLETARHDPAIGRLADLVRDLAAAETTVNAAVRWRHATTGAEALILAGRTLFLGSQGEIIAVDADQGTRLWEAKVEGRARGLAAASGRLYVSSDTGAIYCFGPPGTRDLGTVRPEVQPEPFPADELTARCRTAAEQIVRATGITNGYALVLGSGTGRLAYELARRTALVVYGVEADPRQVAASRQAVAAAGLYGTRVWIDRLDPARVPYADFFANLIVSETALVTARMPGAPADVFRMLKPLGGTLLLGGPAAPAGAGLSAAALRQWCTGSDLRAAAVTDGQDGVWLRFTRGALPGAGSWTHQYAEPGNTTCSDDTRVKCPLGVLWFGEPGPGKMVDRHMRPPAPLAINGRLFIQGEGTDARQYTGNNVAMCYDAYNGVKLWERPVRSSMRYQLSHDAGNQAATEDSFFIAAGAQCLRLDAATGATTFTYQVPPAADGQPRTWGYVAVVGNRLFGSRSTKVGVADAVFAMDLASGAVQWIREAAGIAQSTIAIGGGAVFLTHTGVTATQRAEALREWTTQAESPADSVRTAAVRHLEGADVRLVTALDAATGQPRWERVMDLTWAENLNPYWCSIGTIHHNDVLILFGVYSDGHFWESFLDGQFSARHVTALSGLDGQTLWTKALGYRVRPLVIGDTLHAEPWTYDLKTGRQLTRRHPITGNDEPWQFGRYGHHCGSPAAAPNLLAFRSWSLGWYDLVADDGTQHFPSQRPSCWINFVPANGLLLVPEGGSGCLCPFPNSCTIAFTPVAEPREWGCYSASNQTTPARHLALNFGAPGDRRARDGTLWLGYPRPDVSLALQYPAKVTLYPGGEYFRHDPVLSPVEGTDSPWLFTTGVRGLQRCVLPLLGPGEGAARYTVRLLFAELGPGSARRRPFDIQLMGRVVQSRFDIAREAGGRNRAVVREFSGIEVQDNLVLELVAKADKPSVADLPVLQGIEVLCEKVMTPGVALPSLELEDASPQRRIEAVIANHMEGDLDGELRAATPAGFAVEPAAAPVKVAPGQTARVALTVRVVQKGPAQVHPLDVRLVRRDGTLAYQGQTQIDYLADEPARWAPLDLAPFANRPTRGLEAWIGGGLSLTQVKPGLQRFGKVPFQILDPAQNHDFTCIALRSARIRTTRGTDVPATVEIPVGRKAYAVCFLHGCGWVTNPEPLRFGQYEILYEDGSSAVVPLVAYGNSPEGAGVEKRRETSTIQDWWPGPYPQFSNTYVRPVPVYLDDRSERSKRYLYLLQWTNPAPGKAIRALRLSSDPTKDPSVLILGISLRVLP